MTKALDMWNKWVLWRLEFRFDLMDPNKFNHLLMKHTIILHGHDKANRFCVLVRPRYHTPGEQTLEEMIHYGIFLIEQATKRTEE